LVITAGGATGRDKKLSALALLWHCFGTVFLIPVVNFQFIVHCNENIKGEPSKTRHIREEICFTFW
jgi:hypothetical protein